MTTDPAKPDPATSADAEKWVIVLVPFGESPVQPGRRVARVLKYAKRAMGLRCIEVSSRTPDKQLELLRAEVIELRRRLEKLVRQICRTGKHRKKRLEPSANLQKVIPVPAILPERGFAEGGVAIWPPFKCPIFSRMASAIATRST